MFSQIALGYRAIDIICEIHTCDNCPLSGTELCIGDEIGRLVDMNNLYDAWFDATNHTDTEELDKLIESAQKRLEGVKVND